MTREEEIFAAALALSGEARREFLDRACGDDSVLRENVEALLLAHESAGDFLRNSPADDVFAEVEPQPGDRIGPYLIVRLIGEGGCGLVYLAEQEQPIRRRVALKIVKPGMDSKQVIARFEAERQALAQMEHPDIARVFDAGATPDGHPYFAMEYVDGVPITRFCDETSLPLADRLELFARICLALQHAHQKGIVHRDVKPSNILVALHDGRPAPKIIDFGIAKATQARLTDVTNLTGFEQFIGTPAYMSPEQAERQDLDIDTRSDIYSLGVLLYELLAGQPPFDPKSLVRAGIDEIRRIIREVDPPRPSTALSTLGAAERTTVARRRAAAPERLTSVLRGDLDWIVMRCLEKDRARRYGTANELADDIRRHLRSEPIVARPPSTAYRTKKFVRRHRVACATIAAVALSLVLGTIVSVAQAVRASRAEQDARRRQEEAEDLLTFMLGDFRSELQKMGKLSLLDAVGDKAKAYFAMLGPRDRTNVTMLRYSKALTQIGEIRLDEARFADADDAFRIAYERASFLTAQQPHNAEYLFNLGQVQFWLGFEHREKGDLAGAAKWLTAYRDTSVGLAALDPANPKWQIELGYGHHNLAVLEMDRGNYSAARAGFLAEMKILEHASSTQSQRGDNLLRQKIADLHSWIGSAAEGSGDFLEARREYAEQVLRLETLVKSDPDNSRWHLRLATAFELEASLDAITTRRTEAVAEGRSAREIFERLCAKDPANRTWARLSLLGQIKDANLALAEGNVAEASRLAAQSRPAIEALALAEPKSVDVARLQSKWWRLEATIRKERRLPDAAAAAEQAVRLGEKIADVKSGGNGRGYDDLLMAYAVAAALAQDKGDAATAQMYWHRILAIVGSQLSTSRDWRLLDPAVRALSGTGKEDEAAAIKAQLESFGYRPLMPWWPSMSR